MASRSMPTLTALRPGAVDVPGLEVVVLTPKGRPLVATLGLSSIVVGSSPECDLVLEDDPRVSRRHCQVELTERGVILRDLGSKNGVLFGDLPVLLVRLPIGKQARIGGSTLSVRAAGTVTVLPLSVTGRFGEAIGGSVPMRALFARLERAAATDETVLLLGESGTGKELLARGVHDHSPRRAGPFVIFDCSAVAPNLIEAELFGVVRGAFTGAHKDRSGLLEEANGGTLFIDELGELPLELQPKLLRALEARQVRRVGGAGYQPIDVRVVAATHRDLQARVASGAFREDLYYRLAVVTALVPPLRDRRDDIALLAERFLAAQRPPRALADLPPSALEMLKSHHWPGNVRELRNTIARLTLFPDTAELAPVSSPHPGARSSDGGLGALVKMPLREARAAVVEQFERAYLSARLQAHAGNVTRTAEAIGLSRQMLHRLMDRYGLGAEE